MDSLRQRLRDAKARTSVVASSGQSSSVEPKDRSCVATDNVRAALATFLANMESKFSAHPASSVNILEPEAHIPNKISKVDRDGVEESLGGRYFSISLSSDRWHTTTTTITTIIIIIFFFVFLLLSFSRAWE